MDSQITVRKHKGRSGKSVFEYRVYREGLFNGVKPYRFQLAKYRTEEAAERAAEHYRVNDAENRGGVFGKSLAADPSAQ